MGLSPVPVDTSLNTMLNKENTCVVMTKGHVIVIDPVDHPACNGAVPCDVYEAAGYVAVPGTKEGADPSDPLPV